MLRVAATSALLLGALLAVSMAHGQSSLPSSDGDRSWTLARLMAAQAQRPSGSASFREERHLRSMTDPVVLSGTLSYKPPSRMVKSVTFPHVETLIVDGDRMAVEDGNGRQTASGFISDHPVLEGAIVAMRAVLAGDEKTLRRHFDARLKGNRSAWTLTLKPRSVKVRRRIAMVRVDGTFDRPKRFELRETDGDRIVVSVTPIKSPTVK